MARSTTKRLTSTFLVLILFPMTLLGAWWFIADREEIAALRDEERDRAERFLNAFFEDCHRRLIEAGKAARPAGRAIVVSFDDAQRAVGPFRAEPSDVLLPPRVRGRGLSTAAAMREETAGEAATALAFFEKADASKETQDDDAIASRCRALLTLDKAKEAVHLLDSLPAERRRTSLVLSMLHIKALINAGGDPDQVVARFLADTSLLPFPAEHASSVVAWLESHGWMAADRRAVLEAAADLVLHPERRAGDAGVIVRHDDGTFEVRLDARDTLIFSADVRPLAEAAMSSFAKDVRDEFVLATNGQSFAIHTARTSALDCNYHVHASTTLESDRRERIGNMLLLCAAIAAGISLLIGMSIVRQRMRLSELKSHFVDVVSHELRTPLAALSLRAEMLARGDVPAEKRDYYLESLHRETQRMNTLVNRLLDFARLERGHVPLDLVETDVRNFVGRLVRTHREALRAAGLRLRVIVPRTIGSMVCDVEVLSRAMRNLLENACKYASKGGTLELVAAFDGRKVDLSVADRGPGLGVAGTELFEPFRRGSGSSGVSGVGLGLALVRFAARAHGGDVRAENRDHGGAVFTITIPDRRPS